MNNEHNHDHNEDCNCNQDHDTITLTLDNDEELECYVLGIFDVNEQEYIALLPKEEEDVYIYKYNELEGDEVNLENIEDDNEFELVSKKFEELIESAEDEEDNEDE